MVLTTSTSNLLHYYTVDKTGNYPCPALDPVTGKCKDWQSPFILMVDRGECTFVHKVRRGE